MDKNKVVSDTYIPPTEAERTELIMVKVTPYEKEVFETLGLYCQNLMLMGKKYLR